MIKIPFNLYYCHRCKKDMPFQPIRKELFAEFYGYVQCSSCGWMKCTCSDCSPELHKES